MHKLRHLKLLLLYLLGSKPRDPLQPVVCRFLVTPFDAELTRAASHAYMAFAGLGRWCWSFHNIDWSGLLKERWAPLTHSELVHYRRAAGLFKVIDVTTTLIWWDQKMAYLEHRITQGQNVSAIVFARGTFYKGRERISPRQCVAGLADVEPPEKPAIVDFWNSGAEHFQLAAQQALAADSPQAVRP